MFRKALHLIIIISAAVITGCTTFRSALPRPINDILRPSAAARRIRVAILLSKPYADIKVIGPGTIYDTINHRRLRRFSSLSRAVFRVKNGKILINGRETDTSRILILPDMPQTIKVKDAADKNSYALYRGRINIIADNDNSLTVVNILPLDEYIMGVVPRETFPKWPPATLRSQAVAARTFAVFHLPNGKDKDFDIVSPRHQLYGGVSAETPQTTKAVLDTQGEILTYKGKVLCTYFYTCCGGRTEEAVNIFVKTDNYPGAVESSYCKNTRHYSWNATIALENCREKLNRAGKHLSGYITNVRVIKRFKSGRVAKIQFSSRSNSVVLTGEECRRILGYNIIRSTLFKIRIMKRRLQFVGRGWGHGVGLCQWCSKIMADKGLNYEEILKHFYPGAEIER